MSLTTWCTRWRGEATSRSARRGLRVTLRGWRRRRGWAASCTSGAWEARRSRVTCEVVITPPRSLGRRGPPLTYFRAAMVVGARSESYRTLRYLVERLPVMVAPAWLQTDTQPIGIDDLVAYLSRAPAVAESRGREVQIGGPDVLSYGDMLDRMALA